VSKYNTFLIIVGFFNRSMHFQNVKRKGEFLQLLPTLEDNLDDSDIEVPMMDETNIKAMNGNNNRHSITA
jgi:hypothetical protein